MLLSNKTITNLQICVSIKIYESLSRDLIKQNIKQFSKTSWIFKMGSSKMGWVINNFLWKKSEIKTVFFFQIKQVNNLDYIVTRLYFHCYVCKIMYE